MFSSPRFTGTRLRSAQGACRRPPRVGGSLRGLLADPGTQGKTPALEKDSREHGCSEGDKERERAELPGLG